MHYAVHINALYVFTSGLGLCVCVVSGAILYYESEYMSLCFIAIGWDCDSILLMSDLLVAPLAEFSVMPR